jgi:hypothetical protein
LQVGGLDALSAGSRAGFLLDDPSACGRKHDSADLDLVEDQLNQPGLGGERPRRGHELVVCHQRFLDGGASRSDVEVPRAQVVVEEVGTPALEAVEPGERILPDRDEETQAQVGAVNRTRELGREAVIAVVVWVVPETRCCPAMAARGRSMMVCPMSSYESFGSPRQPPEDTPTI